MNLMMTMTWPLKSSDDIGKAFVGLPALPDFLKRPVLFNCWGSEGNKSYALYEIDKGYEDEGIKAITERYVHFRTVEGCRVTAEVLLSVQDSLAMIGLGQ